ncbi:MAG TPA: hypothetical protein VF173_28510 [Thermoanaerobaculia bacterium]|nr:hypothetical protein [Thermoanaerobaculia bacterium]
MAGETVPIDLRTGLDLAPLFTELGTHLGTATEGLKQVTPPADGAAILGATSGAAQIDTSGVGGAVAQVAAQVGPLLASLPAAGNLLGPLGVSLDLVDKIGTADLAGQIGSLVAKLQQELSGANDGGFIAVLVRLANVLSTAPEGQSLRDLLLTLTRAGGVDLPADALSFPNVLPAIDGTVRLIGGLMALESVLSEADRLTGIMAQQLDPATVQPVVDAALAAFGEGPTALAAFVTSLDPGQPAEVDAAVAAINAGATRLAALRDLLSAAMGFGEGTLVYLDVDQVQTELTAAAAMVRSAALDPVERAARTVAGLVTPLLKIDLSGFPSFDLPGLLAALEAKVADFVAQIHAVDATALSAPLAQGLAAVTGAIGGLADVLTQVTATLRGALDSLRQAVAALPLDAIAGAIGDALKPVAAFLDAISSFLTGIESLLHDAAAEAKPALAGVKAVVDGFQTSAEKLFGDAKAFVDGLHLDRAAGILADDIKKFDDVLAKAQMKPYFDTATAAVSSAADVISAVPFGLLPDSMKSQVEAALQPIRKADAKAVQSEIEALLEITPDGKFELRPELAAAIKKVQDDYQALLDAIRKQDPHAFVQQIDNQLADVKAKIHDLSPQLTLQPVQAAIDQVKAAVAGFDLRKELKPIDDAFGEIFKALGELSPDQLIAPLEAKVKSARDKVVAEIRLQDWEPAIDSLAADADDLLARFDPVTLEPALRAALAEATDLLDRFPDVSLIGGFGNLAALLLSGSGLRVHAWTFDVVIGWLGGGSGTADLLARSGRIAGAVSRTRDAVAAVDLAAIAASLTARVQELQAAIAANPGLPAGSPARLRLEAALAGLDVAAILGPLTANRDRYLAALTQSAALGETLRRIGLSEVDATIVRLRLGVAPLQAIVSLLRGLAARLGLPGLADGLVPALKNLLAVATPERLTAIAMPIFIALRDRADALLQAVVAPIKAGIAELNRLVGAIDLEPLRLAVDAVYQEVLQQLQSLQPSRLLAAPLASFDALKAEVAAFDPLKDVLAIVEDLRKTIEDVLDDLQAGKILAIPLEIYDHVLTDLAKLDVTTLLTPVLDQLDAIAAQVDGGLTETVTAFQRLQQSLPAAA